MPTTPPPFRRPGSRTTPPPVPVEDNLHDSRPDFVLKHERPSEAEFEAAIATIRPARLEQLPVALAPTPAPPPKRKTPTKWIMVGIAICAGAVAGGVLAWRERAKPDRAAPEPVAVHVESVTQLPDLIEISEDEATKHEPETIEMPEAPVERQGSSAAHVWSDEPDDGSASSASLPLSIDKESIGKAIAGVRPAVRRCGVTYPWKGTVKVFLHVRKNGSVGDIKIEQAPAMTLGQCVAQAVSRARFGRTQKGGALRYPFKF